MDDVSGFQRSPDIINRQCLIRRMNEGKFIMLLVDLVLAISESLDKNSNLIAF